LSWRVDLNSDMGESFGRYTLGYDDEILRFVSSANVACGFHASDFMVLSKSVRSALDMGVSVGAHPGYPDLQGFGRRSMDLTAEEVENAVLYQLGAIYAFLKAHGSRLQHLKPHGALYIDTYRRAMNGDYSYAESIGRAVRRFDPSIILVGLAGSKMVEIWKDMGLRVAEEVFADRAYNSDKTLVSRREEGAVITDEEEVVGRVIRMVKEKVIVSISGEVLRDFHFDTICVHGDTPTAVALVRRIRQAFTKEGIEVVPMGEIVG